MKAFQFLTPPPLFLEIGQSSCKALDGERGVEVSLERLETGRLTPGSREALAAGLRAFLKRSWGPRRRAWCAISARGVSLRRLAIPPAPPEHLQQILALQMEKEFPLSPGELAWGFAGINENVSGQNGGTSGQEVLVAAIKKEWLADYQEILCACQLQPCFTLGILAAGALCSNTARGCALLDIGRRHSELMAFQDGAGTAVRILPVGGEQLTREIQERAQLSGEEAERVKLAWSRGPFGDEEEKRIWNEALRCWMISLVQGIRNTWNGEKLCLTGGGARAGDFSRILANELGGEIQCEPIEVPPGPGRSAAILALRKLCQEEREPLWLESSQAGEQMLAAFPPWKWAAVAVLLVAALFSLRYIEAFVKAPAVANKLEEISAARERLPEIDRELGFFQFLQTNQPPYLPVLSAVAEAAARGTRIETFSMNRRGDFSLRGTMQNSQQATDLRTKLISSGLFSTVVLEEQNPVQDRAIQVRISARWKHPAHPSRLEGSPNGAPSAPEENPNPAPSTISPPGPMNARPGGG
jgi:Tfp pilus assembly PilM family ATPase